MSGNTGWFRGRMAAAVVCERKVARGRKRRRSWACARRQLRPALFPLEDRCLLSTFTVNTTKDENDANKVAGDVSLREAIIEANANPGADTIIVPAGTYTLTIPGTGETGGQTGDLDVSDSVTIEGAGADSTIIDANGLDRAFYVFGSGSTVPNVTISGVTIDGGLVRPGVPALGPSNSGGGIDVYNASLTVDKSVIENNQTSTGGSFAGWGGGIAVELGTLTVTSSTITNNSTGSGTTLGGFGGGIAIPAQSTVTISNVRHQREHHRLWQHESRQQRHSGPRGWSLQRRGRRGRESQRLDDLQQHLGRRQLAG